jgi:hypothetical protein
LDCWLPSITLLLIVVSGEELVERGRLEKVRKAEDQRWQADRILVTEFPGRLYQSTVAIEAETRSASTLRLLGDEGTSSPSRMGLITR